MMLSGMWPAALQNRHNAFVYSFTLAEHSGLHNAQYESLGLSEDGKQMVVEGMDFCRVDHVPWKSLRAIKTLLKFDEDMIGGFFRVKIGLDEDAMVELAKRRNGDYWDFVDLLEPHQVEFRVYFNGQKALRDMYDHGGSVAMRQLTSVIRRCLASGLVVTCNSSCRGTPSRLVIPQLRQLPASRKRVLGARGTLVQHKFAESLRAALSAIRRGESCVLKGSLELTPDHLLDLSTGMVVSMRSPQTRFLRGDSAIVSAPPNCGWRKSLLLACTEKGAVVESIDPSLLCTQSNLFVCASERDLEKFLHELYCMREDVENIAILGPGTPLTMDLVRRRFVFVLAGDLDELVARSKPRKKEIRSRWCTNPHQEFIDPELGGQDVEEIEQKELDEVTRRIFLRTLARFQLETAPIEFLKFRNVFLSHGASSAKKLLRKSLRAETFVHVVRNLSQPLAARDIRGIFPPEQDGVKTLFDNPVLYGSWSKTQFVLAHPKPKTTVVCRTASHFGPYNQTQQTIANYARDILEQEEPWQGRPRNLQRTHASTHWATSSRQRRPQRSSPSRA